jgi:hypothetical protein
MTVSSKRHDKNYFMLSFCEVTVDLTFEIRIDGELPSELTFAYYVIKCVYDV